MPKNCYIDAGYTKNEQQELFGSADLSDPKLIEMARARQIELALQKRQTKLQALKMIELSEYLAQHPLGKENAVKSLLTRDKFGMGGKISIEQTANNIMGYLHSKLSDMIDANRATIGKSGRRMLGFEVDQTGMKNIVREMYSPGSTGDAMANAHAKSMSEVFEEARVMFNRMGGNIRKLEGWIPQRHEPLKIRKAGSEAWIADIMPLLDRDKMLNLHGAVMNDQELTSALQEVYKTIATDGVYNMEPGKIPQGVSSKLSNRHQEHRFLHFKDGDSWVSYQTKYGSPDIFSTMMDHLHMMSTEIAALKVMGPNPDSMVKYLDQVAMKDKEVSRVLEGDKAKLTTRMREGVSPDIQAIYDNVMGRTGLIKNGMANVFSSVRNWMVATKLGGAFLSSISDHGFMVNTSHLNDLKTVRMYSRYLKSLNPANAEHRKAAVRLGIVAEYAMDRAISAHRFSEVVGYNAAANISDFAVRASALNAHTMAGKQAFSMEFLASLADDTAKNWENLSNFRREAFARYGINKEDWEYIRSRPLEDIEGEKFVNAANFDDFDRMNKVLGMVMSEMRLAVLEPDAYDRAMLNRGSKAGTVGGEIIRSTMQFKSFPLSVITNHLARGMFDSRAAAPDRWGYLGGLLAMTAVLGGLTIQAKEIAKGNDMSNMDQKFWWKAFAAGGGLGIMGDLMTQDLEKYGGEALATVGGPSAGVVSDLIYAGLVYPAQVALGMYDKGITDIEGKYGKAVADAFRNYMPFNNLWYTRVAMERALFDNVSKALDPEWETRQRKILRKLEKEKGAEKWWPTDGEAPRLPKTPNQINLPIINTPIVGDGTNNQAWQPQF